MLCPTKLGPTGTQALNAELQAMLNPPKKGKPELQSAARVFRVGDKVMQVRNNYEITWQRIGGEQGVGAYNGDIGIVESIDVRSHSMVVRMDDRRLVYPAENLNELEIAYAITVHKSQGSEFPAVISRRRRCRPACATATSSIPASPAGGSSASWWAGGTW
mgnify:CR=1 FL=1